MTWPEAFAVVGGLLGFFGLLGWFAYVESKPSVPRVRRLAAPAEWRSTTVMQAGADGMDASGEPTWLGFTLKQITDDPDAYIEAVRKAYPKARRS